MSVDDEQRPDPDALLKVIEKQREGKGKVKVFFGMAAGVGKTYAMLQEAGRKRQEGTDVVIGYLESHQRKETDALASSLELIPRMTLAYRGKALQEMDTDAIVARKPQLVLVDELAHTNAPGARNRKRYQDVLELTEHGIDVFTTVNVQHLEGFADTVEEITGITITERIPDSVFDVVDQVVLIDISPEELLKRLSEGKVYLGERAEAAAENFFKKSTLAALREMALRYTALLVNHQLSDMLQEGPRQGGGTTGERLLVAISPSPNSAHLIRWTRQRAFNLKAEWTALYVDTGSAIGEAPQESLRKNMNLARQLGAAMVTLPSDNVPLAVIRYARSNSITEIVVGKSGMVGRAPFLRRRTIAERIMKMSGDIDVAVVQEKGALLTRPRVRLTSYLRAERASIAKIILVIAAVTGVNLLALPLIGYRSASILYLMAVIALAFFTDRFAVLIAAGMSALLWDYFFLPPRFTFLITKLEDVLMFFLYFLVAASLAFLMSRLRLNQRMLGVRARRMGLLLDFSQSLARQTSLEGIVAAGLEYVSRYLEVEVIAFLPETGGGLQRVPHSLGGIEVDEKEQGVARWCFDSRTPCGKYTDTLHMARYHYIPLLTSSAAVGVLGVRLQKDTAWLPDQEGSLQMLGRTLSLSIEREQLSEENRRNMMARESERLGRVLLNTVSHELRTPLTTIKGSITALMDSVTGSDPEARATLLSETLTAVDRLNAIVENLLSMSRLESGMLRLKRSPTDMMDLASVVADSARRMSSDHPLTISIEDDIPLVSLDFILMVQVLANLLGNVAAHTPLGTAVQLSVEKAGDGISITVADKGPGVDPEELPHLFETFFRGKKAATGGVGLGLPICKGIVEAHGGTIAAFINRKGGLSVNITLPESIAVEEGMPAS
ncbi:MAG: sensor histidine kinase KdpD [Spirochaetia bacterium]|jgi:two-component system sensor histidine kinase KdpD